MECKFTQIPQIIRVLTNFFEASGRTKQMILGILSKNEIIYIFI